MAREIHYNGKLIETLSKKELLDAIEVCCRQIDDWKESAAWWKKKYEDLKNG